ncbi:LOW QUALITY PROTEIN: hypothetical protein T265_14240 [Opisthorchis viverrini]|uniref:Reverse transcriptase domain-containing protein n=1 Tax=Opisthorchis viverrini TaxID=6198 RepID=A0A074ZDP2_OPIVI|nr:LOW QUALITY PROTEIN: hypothetical protein T265_14240 [Opisthorchis viverrini]KER25293.1 LOW QUALITY PROTEIN: hypothetical protein T265_14240 [Opisthorchis viverrini]
MEYADDIVLVFEEEAQVLLDELIKVIPSFGMHFAPTKCKVMLVDVQSLNTPLTIQGEALEVVERFTYLGNDGVGCETAPNSAKKAPTPSRAGRVAPTNRQSRHSLRAHSVAAPWMTPNRTSVSTLFNFRPAPHYSSVIFKSPIRSGSIKVEPRILDLTEPPMSHTVKRALRMLESKKRTCASVSSDVSSLPASDDDDVLLNTSKRRRLQTPVPNSHEDYDVSAIGNTHSSDGFHFTSIGQLRGTVPSLRRDHLTVSVGSADVNRSTAVLPNGSTESYLTGGPVDRSSSTKPTPDPFRSPISAEASIRRRIPYMSPAELDALFNAKCKPIAVAMEEGEQSGSDQEEFELPSLGRQFSERRAPSTQNVSPHPSRDTGTPLIETTTSATIDEVSDKRPPSSRVNSVARFIANLEAYGSKVSTGDGSGINLSPSIRCLSPSEMSARVSRIRRLLSSPSVSEATGTVATTQVMSSSVSSVPSALPAFSMITSIPPIVSLSASTLSNTSVTTSAGTFTQPASTGAPTVVTASLPFAFTFPPVCLATKSPAASTVPPTTTVASLPTFTLPASSTTTASVSSAPSVSNSSANATPPFCFPVVTSTPGITTPSSVVQPNSVIEKPDSGASVVSASVTNAFVPSCHATLKEHEGWDTARLPKPRQGKSRGRGRVRTTDLPVSKFAPLRLSHLAPWKQARAAFANLRHLWRRPDISFSVKGRVYNAAVRSILLYGSETWPLRAEDVKRLSVFDHRCLRSIARIWWEHRISSSEVRRMVFWKNNSPSITLHRLRWLGHVLRMPVDRLPRRALFAQPHEGWKRSRGGQTMTWQRIPAVTSVANCPNLFNFVSTPTSQPPATTTATVTTQMSTTTGTAAPLFSFSTIPAATTTGTTAQTQLKTSVSQSFTFGSLTSWSSPKPVSTQAAVTTPSVSLPPSSQSETKTSNGTLVTFLAPTTATSTGSATGFNFSIPAATSTSTTASVGFSFATAPLNTTTACATTTTATLPTSSLFQTPTTTSTGGTLKPVFSFPSLSSASSTPSTFGLGKPLATTTAAVTTTMTITTTTSSSPMFNFGSKLGSAPTFGLSSSTPSTTTTTSSAFVFGKADKPAQPSTVFSAFGVVSTAPTTLSTTSANLFTLGVKPATVAGPVTFTAPTPSTTSSWFGTPTANFVAPAFGVHAATTAVSTTSASGFSFASSATNTTGLPSVATAPGQLFQFGASSSGNLFTATTTTSSPLAPAASASPVFAFGHQATTTSPFQTAISSANSIIPSFESPKTSTATSAPFQFGASQSGFNFGQTSLPAAPTATAFGTTPSSTTGFVFGQISNAFGSQQQQQQQPVANNPFAFGTTPPNPSGAIATPRRRVTAARSRRRP